MTFKKRSKNSRQRGSHTHGWGAKKKHRGKGNKGGAGRAGTGKRGDAKKPNVWAQKKYFGRYGFVMHGPTQGESITIRALAADLPSLVEDGKAEHKSGTYRVDLGALGIDKLIATGYPNAKINVTVLKASDKAIEKIEAAGGSVTLTGETGDGSE